MKKYFYLMGLMIGLVVSGLDMSACGSDDDGKGGSTNGGDSNGGTTKGMCHFGLRVCNWYVTGGLFLWMSAF